MAMRKLPKPIVGAINGVAAGAGMSLALATDIRIASDKASFMQAFSRVGLVPTPAATTSWSSWWGCRGPWRWPGPRAASAPRRPWNWGS